MLECVRSVLECVLSLTAVTARGWPSIPVDEVLGTPGSTRRRVFNEKARLWSYSPGMYVHL